MPRFALTTVFLLLALVIQWKFVGGCGRKKPSAEPAKRCYPMPSQENYQATTNDYFYGSTSLVWRRKRDVVYRLKIRHSLILFRGKIFEWGKTEKGRTKISSCATKWRDKKEGESRCSLSDIETWDKNYEDKYGRYNFLTNNCHDYANRLAKYLSTNCGRTDLNSDMIY